MTRAELLIRRNRADNSPFDESLLDLFSLISFLLLLIAFGYAIRASMHERAATSVTAAMAKQTSGVPDVVPEKVMLFIIHRRNKSDQMTVINGSTGKSSHYSVTSSTMEDVLRPLEGTMRGAEKLNIAILEGKEKGDPGIWLALQRWLAENRFENFGIYFARE